MKKDMREELADEVINNLTDLPQGEEMQFSLDEILSEYRQDSAASGEERLHSDPPAGPGTEALQSLAEQMKAFARGREETTKRAPADPPAPLKESAEKPRRRPAGPAPKEPKAQVEPKPSEAPPKPREIISKTADFGPPEEFDRAFAPSQDFVRVADEVSQEQDGPAQKEPGTSVADRLRRWRAKENVSSGLAPDKAAARLKPYIRFLDMRTTVALVLCAAMVFLTYSHQLGISLPPAFVFLPKPYGNVYVFVSILTALQALVMACGIDVLARGLSDLFHFRPGFESVALLSCLANVAYTVSIYVNPDEPVYLPYCAASALSVLCAMWSHRQRLSACRRSFMAVAAAGRPFVIAREESLWPGGALVKTPGEAGNFVSQTEQIDGAVRFARFLAPLEVVAAVMFALIASVGQQQPARFFWALSAVLSVSAPFCGAFCYTLPFQKISKRLSRNGTAIAGWTGARAFFEPVSVVLTDRDFFPPGTVTLNGLKVFEGFSFDRMICYAASLTAASGSSLAHAFEELLHNQPDSIRQVSSFRYYEGGGLGGEIGRDGVLLGNSSFMLRMGIRLPHGIKLENVVFVAVNLELVGVFAIHYNASGAVRNGLSMLLRHGFTPVMATRDVNLTPPFAGKTLGLNLSGAEYPLIEQRLELSEPERESWAGASAVVNRDALYPCAEGIVAGRRLGRVTRINLMIYLLCALAGLLILAFLTFRGEASTASPCNVIAYLALWTLPTWLSSGWVHRF